MVILKKIFKKKGNGNEIIDNNRHIIFLNYCLEDEVYANPLKCLIEHENMEYETKKEKFDSFKNVDLIINVVTSKFYEDLKCMEILEKGYDGAVRIISICFEKKMLQNKLGEIISFADFNETIDEYIMSTLYYKEPFASRIGEYNDEIKTLLLPILHGNLFLPKLSVGNEEVILLAVGSMANTTVTNWVKAGINIKSTIVYVMRVQNVKKGQSFYGENSLEWIIDIENKDNISGELHIQKIEKEIEEWMCCNVGNKKLVVLGGLGKFTGSFLIPLILKQAKLKGIMTYAVCSMPFGFESSNCKRIADLSLSIIKNLAYNVCCFDNISELADIMEKRAPLRDLFDLVSYAIAVAIDELLISDKGDKKIHSIKIVLREDRLAAKLIQFQSRAYGKYEIRII